MVGLRPPQPQFTHWFPVYEVLTPAHSFLSSLPGFWVWGQGRVYERQTGARQPHTRQGSESREGWWDTERLGRGGAVLLRQPVVRFKK